MGTDEQQLPASTQTAFRGGARISSVLYVGAIAAFLLGVAVFGFVKGYAAFGGHSPVIAAILGVGCSLIACNLWRRGLFVESDGVRIVRPWRLRALRMGWSDIARFEMQTAAGRWPVILIRASDQWRIPVPTFPKPRRDLSTYTTLPGKIQSQVDQLNRILQEHANGFDAS